AALLFIDISGFTASMERFARLGSQGIEKFWKMFNSYFCDLLDVIQVKCGDVDCFAGDAILITPDGLPVGKLALATMAACQCGKNLLEKLSPYYFNDDTTEAVLTLHGSIGSGGIRTVDIGGQVLEVRYCV
ncbi:unnamed protein product, partial [Choristocarpus tenellus]